MEKVYQATGKRKTSIATVYLKAGEGKITINENGIDDYFGRETSKMVVHQPLELTNNTGKFDISINVAGGGISGQAGAIRHGITKALLIFNPELRKILKSAGYITRDPRSKERKKYGLAAARKRYQFSKR